MSNNKIRKIAKAYIRKIEKNGIPVKEAYIFGSMIKEKNYYGSDIDICVISSFFGKDRQKERVRLMNLRQGISDLIEPHPYSVVDFQNPFDILANEIKETGMKL